MTVLILAQDADAPTDHLVLELSRRGVPVFQADTSWFPRSLVIDAQLDPAGRWYGTLATEHRSVELDDIRSVWHRDPAAFLLADGLTDAERAYAHREARLGFGGVLVALPGVRWVNHPNRAADAMYKPLQLATAAVCGLRVPPTLVTNAAAPVRQFATSESCGVVQKSFGPNTITEGGRTKVAYTRRLSMDALADLRGVDATATQLQAWVDKACEARIVAVGDDLFTIRITACSEASRIDWRADFDALIYEWIDTPTEVADGIRAYMKSLGLTYAALDFGIDDHGRYWFFEFTDRPALRTSRSWRPVSGMPVDRLPARSGTSVLLRSLDGTRGAGGVGRGSEGAGDQSGRGLAVVDGVVARGRRAPAGGSVPAAA